MVSVESRQLWSVPEEGARLHWVSKQEGRKGRKHTHTRTHTHPSKGKPSWCKGKFNSIGIERGAWTLVGGQYRFWPQREAEVWGNTGEYRELC